MDSQESGRKYLNYEEAVNLAEGFMLKSGIRRFCETVCKGLCCGPRCYYSDNACHKNEGRRLACSLFLCSDLIALVLDKELESLRVEARDDCVYALRLAGRTVGKYLADAYHDPYPQELREEFKLFKYKNLEEFSRKHDVVGARVRHLSFLAGRAVRARGKER